MTMMAMTEKWKMVHEWMISRAGRMMTMLNERSSWKHGLTDDSELMITMQQFMM